MSAGVVIAATCTTKKKKKKKRPFYFICLYNKRRLLPLAAKQKDQNCSALSVLSPHDKVDKAYNHTCMHAQTHTDTDTHTHRHTHTETYKHTQRHTHIHRHTHTQYLLIHFNDIITIVLTKLLTWEDVCLPKRFF